MTSGLSALVVTFLCLLDSAEAKKCNNVVTANVGLTPTIPYYQERRLAWPKALNDLDADLVCLQEVWFEEDLTNIVEAVKSKYRYSVSSLHAHTLFKTQGLNQTPISSNQLGADENALRALAAALGQDVDAWLDLWRGEGPCRNQKMLDYLFCASNCFTAPNAALCVLQSCSSEFFRLEQECITCQAINTSPNILQTVMACLRKGQQTNRMNVEGLLVLSKKPILSWKSERFFPGIKQVLPRGYIKVWVPFLGHATCVHLQTTILPVYSEIGLAQSEGITSYEQQNKEEINRLIAAPVNKVFGFSTGRNILLGDFNAGPALPANIDSEYPDNYEKLVEAGYRNGYVESGHAQCSFCSDDNSLISVPSNMLIDHVFVKGYLTKDSRRILERYEGELLSDHFAIETTVCKKRFWG